MSHLTDMAANGTKTNIKTKSGTKTVTASGTVTAGNAGAGINSNRGALAGNSNTRATTNSNPKPVTNNSGGGNNNGGGGGKRTNSNTGSSPVAQQNNQYYEDPNKMTFEEWYDLMGDYYGEDTDRDSLRSIYNDNGLYAQALAAQQAAIQAGIKKAQGDLEAQKGTQAQQYADMYRQLYINQMNAQKGIDQQLASLGQTGGQAESTLLGLQTNYADALRQGKMAETNALKDLDKAITDAGLSGSIESANAIANNYNTRASGYANALQNLISVNAQENQNRIAMANDRANTNRQYAYNIAMSILGNGQMPDDATLATAGINKNDAMAIVAGNQKATGIGASQPKDSTSGYPGQSNAYSIILNGSQNVAQNQGLNKALQYLEEQYSKNSDALTPYEKNNIAAILRQSY